MHRVAVLLAALLVSGCATLQPRLDAEVGYVAAPARTGHRLLHLGPVRPLDSLGLVVGLQEVIEAGTPRVTIDIDSPGGSVVLGLQIMDLMRDAQANGTTITCRVGNNAMAASMAAVILVAACDRRLMSPTAQLMFHEPALRGEFAGKEHDFRRVADSIADTNQRMAILVASHMVRADGTRWTAAEYRAWINDRDRWVDAAEALEMGAVDKLV
jgi:ATP-dependent protease ClpP protease subunit